MIYARQREKEYMVYTLFDVRFNVSCFNFELFMVKTMMNHI